MTLFPNRARLQRERTQARRKMRKMQGKPRAISKPMRASGGMVKPVGVLVGVGWVGDGLDIDQTL